MEKFFPKCLSSTACTTSGCHHIVSPGLRTGIEINQVVILVVTEDGTVQEFVKDKEEYLPMLEETVTEWSVKNETPINSDGDVSSSGLSNNAIG